jgi:hypothetical protein
MRDALPSMTLFKTHCLSIFSTRTRPSIAQTTPTLIARMLKYQCYDKLIKLINLIN